MEIQTINNWKLSLTTAVQIPLRLMTFPGQLFCRYHFVDIESLEQN